MARAKKSRSKISELEGQADPRAALDSAGLLAACQGVLARLEADLLERARSSPAVTRALEARHQAEKAAERTAESFAGWTQLLATQVAAAWILSCVFVRTLEDRGLLKQARLAGPEAEDSQRQFFQLAPSLTERDYLLTVFRELAHHPAARDLFDANHSPVWKLSPSAAAAQELLALFRTPNATAPAFRFGQSSTRFLGDLYQDLSEDVRKRYALLQTPDFIESFILDRTLEPAIQRFGLDDTTLIDPTCGSGHFLLGAFDRLFDHRLRAEPGIDPRVAAVRALDCVYGADINPYAVAVARFRLTLSFLEKAGYRKLAEAPALPLHLVVADSLRINPQHAQAELWQQEGASAHGWLGEAFTLEDEKAARDVLFRQYAAVVGNPPYITVKDAAMREVYRKMYKAAAGKYALSAPFCERLFQLARPRGYTGQITANSFMKREFGRPLIEEYLPTINLECIVNTSGAYIPGHGTPTVLLFGTHEMPQGSDVLAVLAKRGEPSTPNDPAQGMVWRSIATHIDEPGFEDEYISVARVIRDSLAKHPWSLGGGGAGELKDLLEERAERKLESLVDSIGFMAITGQDEVYVLPRACFARHGLPSRVFGFGEAIRDWSIADNHVLFPYDYDWNAEADIAVQRWLWPYRTLLKNRLMFGKTQEQVGHQWFEYRHVGREKLAISLSIAFAFVATHNHFMLDRSGAVFKQTAPIIKLPKGASDDDHLALLAYLNSSTACFWMKQVFYPKGTHSEARPEKGVPEENRFEFTSTGLAPLPLPRLDQKLALLAREMESLNSLRISAQPRNALLEALKTGGDLKIAQRFSSERDVNAMCRMVSVQEDIDWYVYYLFDLVSGEAAGRASSGFCLTPDERPFVATAPHLSWNKSDCDLWLARKRALQGNLITLIEHPVMKRRWWGARGVFASKVASYEERWHDAARECLADCWEKELGGQVEPWSRRVFLEISTQYVKALLDYFGSCDAHSQFDLLRDCSVPFLSCFVYSESGLKKRVEWESCWQRQREEDLGRSVEAQIAPKYDPDDFVEFQFWSFRGKLDVPKERFISYPGCESDIDGEPVYGWAGWDHLQRAKALATLYLNRRDQEGWTADRLTPMLAGLLELIPWVKQWHNEPSEEFGGLRMGDYYEQFLDGECRRHGLTHDDLRAWRPAKKVRGGGKAAAKGKSARVDPEVAGAEAGTGQAGEESAAPKKRRTRKPRAAAGEAPAGEEAE